MYYWVVDYKVGADGKTLHPVVIGGRCFSTESRAQQYLDESDLSQRVEIIPLPTSNMAKASSQIKGILIRRYKDLDSGTARAVHTLHPKSPGGSTCA